MLRYGPPVSVSEANFQPVASSESNEPTRWRLEYLKRVILERRGNIQLSLKTLSAEIGVSEQHLGRAFKASTGVSFRSYLRDIRTEEAKRLLGVPTLSVKEIAGRLGYSEPSNFVKDFHAVTNMTPVGYRCRLLLGYGGSTATASGLP
jgi:two-component system response regulator YesN